MEEMNKLIEEKVIRKTLEEIILKNGQPALTLYGDHTHLYIQPSGKFIIGGPQGDAGLTWTKDHHRYVRRLWVRTVVGPSPARTPPRWTGLLLTFADRWPSLL